MLGRTCTLSPTSCSGLWQQPSPVATCRGQLATRTCLCLSFRTAPTSPTALWLNILLVYRNSALLTPPRPAAAAGELLEFPAQPDSAQSSCTFLPPLGCGVWNASGRKLGILPSGPVVIPHTLSPVQNLFLIFIPP